MRIIEPYQLHGYHNQRKKRKRLRHLLKVLFLLVILTGGYGAYTYFSNPPALSATNLLPQTVNQEGVQLTWPAYGQSAVGAVGYEVLASSGNTSATPTASIAKIMTALSVLDKHPLELNQQGPLITFTETDTQLYRDYLAKNGSVVLVTNGGQMTQYQALQALLLPSGNNMADTLASWAFGSMDNYLDFANNLAQKLGMTQSQFGGDASGFSPLTTSTARDLVKLGLAALEHPVIAQIVGQPSADIPIAGNITNTNILIGKNDIIGIKTGNTDQAGNCYLYAAKHSLSKGDTVTVVGVVMGAPSAPVVLKDSLNLLQSSYANFIEQTVVSADEAVAEYRSPWGEVVTVTAKNEVEQLIWRGRHTQTKVSLDTINVNSSAKQEVGTLSVNSGKKQKRTALILQDKVKPPSFWWRVTHPF